MGQITNGIQKIEVGDTGANGTMGSSLSTLGYTFLDSASITEDDGTTTDFEVEELDTPLFSRTTPGKTTLVFQVADPNVQTFLKVFGGTVTGSGDSAIWNAPRTRDQKEWSVKVSPKSGLYIQIPRAKLSAKNTFNLGKNNLTMIEVTLEVLTPADTGTSPIMVGGVVDNTGTPGQSQTITFSQTGTVSQSASPISLTATASSGLPVTYMTDDPLVATIDNNDELVLLNTGTVNVIAMQQGNGTYAAATPVIKEFTIS